MRRAPFRFALAAGVVIAVAWVSLGEAHGARAEAVPPSGAAEASLELPSVMLTGVEYTATVEVPESVELPPRADWTVVDAEGRNVGGGVVPTRDADGARMHRLELEGLEVSATGRRTLRVQLGDSVSMQHEVRVLWGWLSLLPPLVAIGMALALRQVVLALVAGVWLGALFLSGWDPVAALLSVADEHAAGALADTGHARIILFTLLLGGMINVITRSGGGAGLAQLATRRATTSSRGQLATWMLGLVVFFDDYANSLLVGSSMRPISDRLRISREKLAFLVDATAAPVSSIAIVSSWIGVEVGYIADQYAALGLEGDPYFVFLQTIPYRFYPLLMLFFGLALVVSRRDFSTMRRAELRAREHGKLVADGARPASEFSDADAEQGRTRPQWWNAVVPVVAVVATAVAGMYVSGRAGARAEGLAPTLRNIFGHSDSLQALLWASLVGCAAAILMAVGTRTLRLSSALDSWLGGLKAMVLACVILILAWSLGGVCKEVQTASFIVSGIGGWLAPSMLPATVFVVSAVVSFATGTSWGTMAILFPLVMPMAHQLAPGDAAVMLSSVASILGGSVWGDHCSPISDTTIMSSLASSCDHVDHVRTQLPYALLVGLVSLLFGEVAVGLGLYPGWVGLLLAMGVLVGAILLIGRAVPEHRPATAVPAASPEPKEQ